MPFPVCYLNGEFQPLSEARISPLDRGFLFADSVYEVLPVFDGRMFRFREHFDRLARSLREIRIDSPHSHDEWHSLLEELIRRNGGGTMYVYVQVTRGMEVGRNHTFPAGAKPTVFALASQLPVLTDERRGHGFKAITVEDFRWGRCDIKSTGLLANVLAKQQAADAGADEAIFVRDNEVMEGSSTSIFIVKNGVLVTPANSNRILPGTTRDAALEFGNGLLPIEIRSIRLDELRTADEVWMSSATRDVLPITQVDGRPIGDGKPGPQWRKMSSAFHDAQTRLSGTPAL